MSPVVVRLLIVAAVVAGAALAGWWWQRRDGRVTTEPAGDGRRAAFGPDQLDAVGLDPSGAEALGVLLSSPGCAPCRTVRGILGEVAADRESFRWVAVDAADHLRLAEEHHVMRVPTLFVLAPDGHILARTSGVPATRELVDVLDRERSELPA